MYHSYYIFIRSSGPQLSRKTSCKRPPRWRPGVPVYTGRLCMKTGRPTRVQALSVAILAIIAWSVSYLWCWFPIGTLLWKDTNNIFTTLVACDVEISDLISVFWYGWSCVFIASTPEPRWYVAVKFTKNWSACNPVDYLLSFLQADQCMWINKAIEIGHLHHEEVAELHPIHNYFGKYHFMDTILRQLIFGARRS